MERKYLVQSYSADGVRMRKGLTFSEGKGSYLIDTQGKRYLDFGAGIAVNILGHSDPEWMAAVARQLGKLTHTSNLVHTEPPLRLAKLLAESAGLDRAFFCNSGTEANEAALKFARLYALSKEEKMAGGTHACSPSCKGHLDVRCGTEHGCCRCWPQSSPKPHKSKTRVIAFRGGFHGRTMGALSVTHKPVIRQPFAPLVPDVTFAKYNDLDGETAMFSRPQA